MEKVMLQVRNTSASCMGSNGIDVGQDNVVLASLMCFLYSNYRKTYVNVFFNKYVLIITN